MTLLDLLHVAASQPLVGPGIHCQRLGARDVDARRLQVLHFPGIIGEKPDRMDFQIPQDLRRPRILAGIGRIAEFEVCLGLGPPVGLQCPAAHKSQMPMASTLLIQPDDEAAALLLDH